jgi:hypothetical protein
MMAKDKTSQAFKLGDRVEILRSPWRGRIIELRGALGPGGVDIYRVRISRKKMKPILIEVREDQLKLIPAETGAS